MEQSHPPYVGGAISIPRQLQRWLDINLQNGPLNRTQSYITLPTFSIDYTWLGYSDIIATFNYEGPNNFSLLIDTTGQIQVVSQGNSGSSGGGSTQPAFVGGGVGEG